MYLVLTKKESLLLSRGGEVDHFENNILYKIVEDYDGNPKVLSATPYELNMTIYRPIDKVHKAITLTRAENDALEQYGSTICVRNDGKTKYSVSLDSERVPHIFPYAENIDTVTITVVTR